tara:strand:+ start:465 stop:866 length:402 start_codon:yes stop_codon:yes gene_type:complete
MKVKILKCSRPEYWYSDRVGEEFVVVKEWTRDWQVTGGDRSGLTFVEKSDGVIVTEDNEENEDKDSALDTQVGGDHYKDYKMQPMEIAYDYKLSPALAHCLPYILRYKKKNGKQDLEKAIHCLQLAIELEYGE